MGTGLNNGKMVIIMQRTLHLANLDNIALVINSKTTN